METEITLSEDRVFRMIQDNNPMDPREWDNLGTMACFHRRYDLGDKGVPFTFDDFNSWSEMEEYIWKELDASIVLPLYMYDHSGITISTSPFSCNWDSGQIGFIYATKEEIRNYFGIKKISSEVKDKVKKILLEEVKAYDQFVTGDVYGYEIVKLVKCSQGHAHEQVEDSCWGFFGYDIKENGMLDHIRSEDAKIILGEL